MGPKAKGKAKGKGKPKAEKKAAKNEVDPVDEAEEAERKVCFVWRVLSLRAGLCPASASESVDAQCAALLRLCARRQIGRLSGP